MQNTHLDWIIFGADRWRCKGQENQEQPPFGLARSQQRKRFHGDASTSAYTRVLVVMPLAMTVSIDLNWKRF